MAPHPTGTPAPLRRGTASVLTLALTGAALVTATVVTSAAAAPEGTTAADGASLLTTSGTTWHYLDDNTDPAAAGTDPRDWTTTAFDDSAWKTGTGAFGAKRGQATGIGDAFPITTLLTQYIEDTTTDVPTFFFRTDVDLTAADLDGVPAFEGEIVYDDAAIVYVNGEEVARLGDEDREITQNLQYFGTSRTDPVTSTFVVPADAFEAGENTISVALYQDAPTSSDIYLDVRSLVPVQGDVRDVTLGIGADETQATVAWFANLPGSGEVQWAPATDVVGGMLPLDARSATSVADASVDGATYHHAAITGLEEDSSYVYRVGSAATGWSEPATFDTGTFGDDFSFLFVGDIQIGASGSTSNDTASWVRNAGTIDQRHPDAAFLVSAGDQVDSSGSSEQYAGLFSAASMRTLRFAPDVGNHDAGSMLYDQHYARPNATEGQRDYWYAYGAFVPRRIGGDDIKLIRITTKPNLPTLPLIGAADNDLEKRCTMIGWGLGTGAPVASQGWNWNDIRKQRWGVNDTLGILGSAEGFERLMTSFNFGSTSDEASVANTDSGGGLFVKVAGIWKLAGIAVDADSNGAFYDNDLTKEGNQADRSYFVRIKNHRTKIKKIMAAAVP